jgi:hypothetical protein
MLAEPLIVPAVYVKAWVRASASARTIPNANTRAPFANGSFAALVIWPAGVPSS